MNDTQKAVVISAKERIEVLKNQIDVIENELLAEYAMRDAKALDRVVVLLDRWLERKVR